MFVLHFLTYFSRCHLRNISINISKNTSRSILHLTCAAAEKDDVYTERIKERMKSSSCFDGNFPLRMDTKYRVAIITGGETGIGLAAAGHLLANEAQTVVLAGLCEGDPVVKKLNEEYGQGRAFFMHTDVNDPRDLEELFYRVDLVFGKIDIVFNNAGVLQDDVWEYEVDTNLKSVIRGTLLGMDYMGRKGKGKRKGEGVIINHSDAMALEGNPYAPVYSASKAGIIGATLSFGAKYHYNQTGVRVVGLLSGPTNTNMIKMAGDKQLVSEWGKLLVAYLSEPPPQSPAVVGSAATYLVKYAPPGSLWTINRGELCNTEIHSFNTKVTQL